MKKRCSLCGKKRLRTLFHKRSDAKDGLNGRCKPCARRKTREWNEENRDRRRVWSRDLHAKKRALVDRLKDVPCKDCDHRFPPECMDFDHVRGRKLGNVATMVYDSWSEERIVKEISKCEVVCANCHRIRTKKRANQ